MISEFAKWLAGGMIVAMLLALLFVALGADLYDWWRDPLRKRPGFIGNRWRR